MPKRSETTAPGRRQEIIDDLGLLLDILPAHIRRSLEGKTAVSDLVEIVLDLGRLPEARYARSACYLEDFEVTREDLLYVVDRIGTFTADNRAGIERTLHRISAIRNRRGDVVGLTCRVGRAITGTVDIIRDLIATGKSLLLLGPPGVGKTTLLREAARVMADEIGKRVVVVDTSNEIAGDGDVPHPSIGHARRMQVPSPDRQHAVMIEAVENHMPEVIVIDEIGNEREAAAARTIAERGVQLVGTAHGQTLENLTMNPTLADLVGGIQPVTLSDEEARRRGTQKTVLERKAPPTFDILVEIQDRDRFVVYPDLAGVVDRLLAGVPLRPEVRVRSESGGFEVQSAPARLASEDSESDAGGKPARFGPARRRKLRRPVRLYPIGISRSRLEKAIRELHSPVKLADQPINADIVLSLKAQAKKEPKKLQLALDRGVEFFALRSNTLLQIREFLQEQFPGSSPAEQREMQLEDALTQAEDGLVKIQRTPQPVELDPQNSYVRRMQHELIQGRGFRSESVGTEPRRRVIIFPNGGEE